MKINRDALKARVKKYAPAVIAVVSTVTAITAVLYYRKKVNYYEDVLNGDLYKKYGHQESEFRLEVHPEQLREVLEEGAVLQYWLEADGKENLITTTVLPTKYISNEQAQEPADEIEVEVTEEV